PTGSPASTGRASAARQRSQIAARRQSSRRGRRAGALLPAPSPAASASWRKNGRRSAASLLRQGGSNVQTRSGNGVSRKAQGKANSGMVRLPPPARKGKQPLGRRRIKRAKRRWRHIGRIGEPASGTRDEAAPRTGIG